MLFINKVREAECVGAAEAQSLVKIHSPNEGFKQDDASRPHISCCTIDQSAASTAGITQKRVQDLRGSIERTGLGRLNSWSRHCSDKSVLVHRQLKIEGCVAKDCKGMLVLPTQSSIHACVFSLSRLTQHVANVTCCNPFGETETCHLHQEAICGMTKLDVVRCEIQVDNTSIVRKPHCLHSAHTVLFLRLVLMHYRALTIF